ncbi:MAG: MFS transporter [Caldithrix sp.]|nr:MFS transporter [Caldithrix sp.]
MSDTIHKKKSLLADYNLHLIFAITLMAVLGVSSVAPAFPKIIETFGISEKEVGLLITVFTLPGIFLTPILGILADRWGRKKVIVPSLIVFGIGGGACIFAQTFTQLIILRSLQGVGAAVLGSLNITLIGDMYTGSDRLQAMGYNASILSIGTASYPVLGGALAVLGWNFPFILPLAAVPLAVIVLCTLKNPEPDNEQSSHSYLSSMLSGLKNKRVLLLFLITMATFIILYGSIITYFPILVDRRFAGSSVAIGLLLFIQSVTTAFAAAMIGRIHKIIRPTNVILIAFIFYTAACLIIPVTLNLYLLALPMFFFGLAMGFNMPSVQTELASYAPMENRAVFMSLNGMILRLGQTLGPLIIGLFYSWRGLNMAFFGGGGIAVIILILIKIYDIKKTR